jgi:tetratricopeptide (TPR) repeat protein
LNNRDESLIDGYIMQHKLQPAYQMIEELLKNTNDQDEQFEIQLKKIKIQRYLGKHNSVLEHLKTLQPSIDKLSIHSQILFYLELVENLYRQGDNREIDCTVMKLEDLIHNCDFGIKTNYLAPMYELKSKIAFNQERIDDVLHFAKLGIDYCLPGQDEVKVGLINSIGLAYFHKGQLEKAIEYYSRSLILSEELNYIKHIGVCYNNLGYTYYTLKDPQMADKNLKNALKAFKTLENDYYIATSIFNVIRTAILVGNKSTTSELFKELEEIASKEENKSNQRIQSIYLVIKAILLFNSRKPVDNLKSAEVFREVIENEMEYQFRLISITYLLSILLVEYKMFNYSETFEEIKKFSSQLELEAKKQSSKILLTQAYIFHAKILLLEENYILAQDYYTIALKIARDNNFELLSKDIEEALEDMKEQLLKMKDILNTNMTVSEKMEQLDLLEYLNEVKNSI